ncbi:hypothetical protein [Jeotgalibacillus terrae]|uniref:DUF3993 domain-containing protein n=1 Tax=Jeotgalibacillus terrae TaxID=587735 RepID=A0ABW5ZH23_9BACL|nr:hypothetical protein [Jeotgalibacillus terrae]MBM7578664.1 hypothetical protein [Jeotgalibacillus terrae]
MNTYHENKTMLSKLAGMMFFVLSVLLITGCSDTGAAEETDKSKEAIQAVIEEEFNGPDETYIELSNTAMELQQEAQNQEEYDAYLQSPENKKWEDYMADTYASYFTEDGYEDFITITPAYGYSHYEHDYNMSTSDLEITRSEKNPKIYRFTFTVEYESGNSEPEQYDLKGEAILTEEGKIERIIYGDRGELRQRLSDDSNSQN